MTLLVAAGLTAGLVLASIDVMLGNPNAEPMPYDMKIWFLSVITASWLMAAVVFDLKRKS